ncbi:MAG: SGNH/GDSL hydrolase family protein [Bdellovibrionota bacterium]
MSKATAKIREVEPTPSHIPGSRVTPRDSIALKLGLALLGTLLALVVLEVGVRSMARESISAGPAWMDRATESYVPESSPDNRNFAYAPEKAPGTFRIVVIGDSFTFAGKVHFDDNFATRLGRMLNLNDHQPKVEVLNWGVPGFSTFQERELVKKALLSYQPDVILLEITLNDPELTPFSQRNDRVEKRRERMMRSFLAQHWKTYALLMNRIYNTLQNREYLDYHHDLFNDAKTWGTFSDSLEKIGDMAKNHNVPVVGVIFPFFSHVIGDRYPFIDIHEKIVGELEKADIHPLDLRPFYNGIPPERLQAIPGQDAHPNEIAHRIAADAIYAKLAAENLIPKEAEIKKLRPGGRRLARAIFKGKIVDSTNDDEKDSGDSGESASDS